VQTANRKQPVPAGEAARGCHGQRGEAAFTLPEVLISALLLGVAGITLFAGFGQGVTITDENGLYMRATQIVSEKMETIRLYTWDQVTNGTFIPTSFTNYYYPSGNSNVSAGVTYTGTLVITNTSLTEAYSNDVRLVTVTVNWYAGSNWTSGRMQHQLQTSTFVAHYGMQNYVYGTK
jgi:Tfp pilus assembly protein PilV